MTQMSPPGWHPDPGYTGIGPVHERWWDGNQWTDHLRVPPAAIRRRRMRIGITAGVVVLAAIGGGLFLLSDNSGDSKESAATAPSTAPSGPPGGGGESQAPERQLPQTEDGYATDLAGGISLPVPDGWTGKSGIAGAGVTTGEYACPGDSSQQCVRGGVFSMPAKALKLDTTTAKATATKDISANATESYGEKIYGGITSHQELKSGPVTVAGEQGYLVRWKVVTKSGDDGYVQSLAFPSPRSTDTLIVVRSGFDINTKAPDLSVMDDITKGIKAASGTGSGPGTTA
ncbi:membrane protein [Streptomyces atratus]|nr:membrane protein [Streptomyces atratus]